MIRDVLAWALATELVGLAVLPLLRSFFDNRRDAALLSRPIGLAVVAYVGWALSLATPLGFRRVTLLVALVAVGGRLALRPAPRARRTRPRARRGGGGNGATRRSSAPSSSGELGRRLPADPGGRARDPRRREVHGPRLPELARALPRACRRAIRGWPGKTINYYYWGYLLAAAQAQLSGRRADDRVQPLGRDASPASRSRRPRLSGCASPAAGSASALAAGAGAVFAGNLAGALDAWNAPFAADFDYWHASRVIGPENFKTINEFPFFTFFHADLHPHLLAFPFFIAAFVVAHRWVEAGNERGSARWPSMLLVALVAGTARAANFWNLPAMAILLVACGVFRPTRGARLPGRRSGDPRRSHRRRRSLVASLVLFYPYTSSFVLESNGLGRATMFSGLIEFAGVWGILLAVCALGLWPRTADDSEAARRRRDLGLALAAAGGARRRPRCSRCPPWPSSSFSDCSPRGRPGRACAPRATTAPACSRRSCWCSASG